MKSVFVTMAVLALGAPAGAQQAPMDHSAHMMEMQQPPTTVQGTGRTSHLPARPRRRLELRAAAIVTREQA